MARNIERTWFHVSIYPERYFRFIFSRTLSSDIKDDHFILKAVHKHGDRTWFQNCTPWGLEPSYEVMKSVHTHVHAPARTNTATGENKSESIGTIKTAHLMDAFRASGGYCIHWHFHIKRWGEIESSWRVFSNGATIGIFRDNSRKLFSENFLEKKTHFDLSSATFYRGR
jgi:hypothetical protein